MDVFGFVSTAMTANTVKDVRSFVVYGHLKIREA